MKGNLKRLLPAIERGLREADQRRERRRLEIQLNQLKRFEAIGRLAGGIAHDFNNVLGVIMGWAEIALDQTSESNAVHEHLRKIRDQAESAAGMTRQLLAFARRQVLQPRNININAVVSGMLNLLRTGLGDNITLETNFASEVSVTRTDTSQLEQVVMNLVWNARDAMPQGGKVSLETRDVEVTETCTGHAYGSPESTSGWASRHRHGNGRRNARPHIRTLYHERNRQGDRARTANRVRYRQAT
jgi:signal transduction histidine kinase